MGLAFPLSGGVCSMGKRYLVLRLFRQAFCHPVDTGSAVGAKGSFSDVGGWREQQRSAGGAVTFFAKQALSGRAFTLVNPSIRFYRTLYLLGHFGGDRRGAGFDGNGRLSQGLAAERNRDYK